MEIQNKYEKKDTGINGKKSRKKKIFLFIAIACGLLFFGLTSFIFGAYMYKTNQLFHEIFFIKSLIRKDLSFVPNSIKSSFIDLEKIKINIKFSDYEKLKNNREKALEYGWIYEDCKSKVPAEIIYNGINYKVAVSLAGQFSEHVYHPEKWSLEVKVKEGKTIMGMKKFALLLPNSRGYLTDWIAHKILETRRVITLRNNFMDVSVNGKNMGVYYLEERYDKLLVENNKFREGILFKIDRNELIIHNEKKIHQSKDLSEQLANLRSLWDSFINYEIKPEKLFDLKKMASATAVSELMNRKHPLLMRNIRFYYNPSTNLIEPIVREFDFMVKEHELPLGPLLIQKEPEGDGLYDIHHRLVKASPINLICDNPIFEELYLKELQIISQKTYLDSVLAINKKEFDVLLGKVHKENPFYVFPKDVLYENQKSIINKISITKPALKVIFKKLKDNVISFEVENRMEIPLEIKYLSYGDKKLDLDSRVLIAAKHKINGFQSISVPNKNFIKEGFSLGSLYLYYGVLGLDQVVRCSFLPSEIKNKKQINPVKQTSTINQFPFLKVDESLKTIQLIGKTCRLDKDLYIPEGYIVSAKPGNTINLVNSARIISYSPLVFFGTKDLPIKITSSDNSGQGIVVYNCAKTSHLFHVQFSNLSNIVDFGWNLKGAITFYESPVVIDECLFKNNKRGDDYLNIIRTNFAINNTVFENTLADAFDADYCKGTIKNVKFIEVGNDAIDVSGTKLFGENITIDNPSDKGISAGEGSHLKFKNITIRGGEIGVVSKDNSFIEVDRIVIEASKLGYCAFQKKSEYGPGFIKIINGELKKVGFKYLIEVGSSLSIEGKDVKEKTKDVSKRLYGGEFGKKS